MKTSSLLTSALAALLLAACSQNEITEISPDAAPAVQFGVYATSQTRGAITDNGTGTTSIKATGFGILAYHTGQSAWNNTGFSPNFMYNQQVTHSGSWSYTPQKYWPNTEGDKITFFAYAPYESSPTNGNTKGVTLSANTKAGAPTLKFKLQATATDLIDLVATNVTDAVHTTGDYKLKDVTKSTATVKFKFDHVLTRLAFKARLDASPATETHIFVTGMRLVGYNNNNSSKFYSEAVYEFYNGKWNYTTVTPTKQAADYPINGIMPLTDQKSVINNNYTTQGIKITSTTTGDVLFKTNEYLFLIPPTDDTGIDNNEVKVEIDYDIVTKDAKLDKEFSVTSTKATVSLPAGTLKRNTAYDFLFTIGLEKVLVEAEVKEWTASTTPYIPAVDAANATNTTINAALTTLSTIKGANKNCNYFVVNVTGAPGSSVTLTAPSSDNFVVGDKIELKCSSSPSGTFTLANWTVVKNSNSITLTKNK